MSNGKSKIVLPLVLAGAILLSAIGFIGMLATLIPEDDNNGEQIGDELLVSREFQEAEMIAEDQFDGSLGQAEIAKAHAPDQRAMPPAPGFGQSPVDTAPSQNDQGRTRSEDELLSQEGYVSIDDAPDAPAVEMDDTFSLLNGKGSLLQGSQVYMQNKEAPDQFEVPEMDEEPEMPVEEDGMTMDTKQISDIDSDLEATSGDIEGYLGEYSPDTTNAGLTEDDVEGFTWDISNKTTRDTDKDGDPEFIYELRVVSGQRNDSALNGLLSWVVGFQYIYEDINSDGMPNKEEITIIKLANYTINGNKIAEGVSYSYALKNDTDGDNVIDRVEVRHLSYGYRQGILIGIKSYATAGELIMIDANNDGTFEDKEGTAVFFYKHETKVTKVTVRESVVMMHGKDKPAGQELSKLAFTRINSTAGTILQEKGYAWSVKVQGNMKNLMIVAANNNTVTNRLQYVIFNGTETVTDTETIYKVTALAVDNRTLLFGGKRSDFAALDYEVKIGSTTRTDKGALAVARVEDWPNRDTESYMWISVEKNMVSGSVTMENVTIVAGHNVTTGSSLNSTTGLIVRVFQDNDGNGNPEYLKEAVALVIVKDTNSDGIKEWEGYAAVSKELWDNNSDGNPERNFTFFVMGWKNDPDGDGNIDTERSLMVSVNRTDANSNGYYEYEEEGWVGSLKQDDDSDGTIDTERTVGKWIKRTDTYDDGTEINEQSGTWTDES